MTQDCSLPSSIACGVDSPHLGKSLPNGIHIIETDTKSASREGNIPSSEEELTQKNTSESVLSLQKNATVTSVPWGYIRIQHMSANVFEDRLQHRHLEGDYRPKCFIHRTVRVKQKPNGKGVTKEQVPTVGGLVFLQGTTRQLRTFLRQNFPQYYLCNNCSTHRPASIPDSVMRPFMAILQTAPDRITFMRDPFIKFVKGHVRLRVLTGPFAGQEGYIIRIKRDRQLIMDFAGYAVAISGVHKEDFEVVEEWIFVYEED